MYGIPKPSAHENADSFSYKQWFLKVYNYVLSQVKIKTTTAAYTIEADIFYIRVDATSGAITVTLPVATNCGGRQVAIKKIDSSVNSVTIARASTDTIEGSASMALASQWDKQTLISNGVDAWEKL